MTKLHQITAATKLLIPLSSRDLNSLPSFNNSKSFSSGVKFKSKHKCLLLLDFFTIDAIFASCDDKLEGSSWCRFSFKPVLCLLICPPNACPIVNSTPQIGHLCVLGFVGCWFSVDPLSPSINLGFLWLARCHVDHACFLLVKGTSNNLPKLNCSQFH
ncbi:hypothetical protein GQ457_14G023460 [Hibiscus cannabinus]